MKEEKDILERVNHRDGMTVPEGYFADFAARMAASLPPTAYEQSATAHIKPRPFWQQVRPYIYMAAMFAGVWCMIKVFTNYTITADGALQPSEVLADALGNDLFVNDYIIDNVDEDAIYDSMMDNGVNVMELNFDNYDDTVEVDYAVEL